MKRMAKKMIVFLMTGILMLSQIPVSVCAKSMIEQVSVQEDEGEANTEDVSSQSDGDALVDSEHTFEEAISTYLLPDTNTSATESDISLAAIAEGESLKDYLSANSGTLSVVLTDQENNNLSQLVKGGTYKIVSSIYLQNGIVPGVYKMQLEATGLIFSQQSGEISTTKSGQTVNLGQWTVDEHGLVTFVFNEQSNDYTDVRIYASLSVMVDQNVDQVLFDGISYAVIEPPTGFEVAKSGFAAKLDSEGNPVDKNGNSLLQAVGTPASVSTYADRRRFFWTSTINSSQPTSTSERIAGSVVRDELISEYHFFTVKDQSMGVWLGFTDDGGQVHNILLTEENGLSWTNKTWSYTFPESVNDNGVMVPIKDNYKYEFKFYSTPDYESMPVGRLTHYNKVFFNTNYEYRAGVATDKGVGEHVGQKYNLDWDAITGKGKWSTVTKIPKFVGGYATDYYFADYNRVQNMSNNRYSNIGIPTAELPYEILSFTVNGNEIPNLKDADPLNDVFCYDTLNARLVNNTENYEYTYWAFNIKLMHLCNCNEENCGSWSGGHCNARYRENGYCSCWTYEEDADIYMEYTTNNMEAFENYGGLGYRAENAYALYGTFYDNNREKSTSSLFYKTANHPLPGYFSKELIEQPGRTNNYVASYQLTINEAMSDLGSYNGGVVITDVMTDTLVYMAGTTTIIQIDKDNNEKELIANEDYSISYNGDEHTLTMEMQHPGPYKYIVKYDAQIVLSSGQASADYSNSAQIQMVGRSYTAVTESKHLAEVAFSATNYSVGVRKTDTNTGVPVANARYGLYSVTGEQIDDAYTDQNGSIVFRTNVSKGVTFKSHVAYYIQEISAPSGYRLDPNQYWLFFCENEAGCGLDNTVVGEGVMHRIYADGELYYFEVTDDSLVSVLVTKKWQDDNNKDHKRPDSITVTLYKNDIATEHTIILNEENGWSAGFYNLDEYAAGNKITYSIGEVSVEGYTPQITGDVEHGFLITNVYVPDSSNEESDLENELGDKQEEEKDSSQEEEKDSSQEEEKDSSQEEEKDSSQEEEKDSSQEEEKDSSQEEEKDSSQEEEKDSSQEEEKDSSQEEEKDSSQEEEKDSSQEEKDTLKEEEKNPSQQNGNLNNKEDVDIKNEGNLLESNKNDKEVIEEKDTDDKQEEKIENASEKEDDDKKVESKKQSKKQSKSDSKQKKNPKMGDLVNTGLPLMILVLACLGFIALYWEKRRMDS